MRDLLPLYLTRLFGLRVLAAAAALAGLLQVLELLEVTTEVLERDLGLGGIVQYAALRLPSLLPQVLPLAVLVGAALTLASMAGRSEVVALRSAGVSLYRLIATMLPAAVAVAAVHLIVAEQVAPRTEAALTAWWARSAPPAEEDAAAEWFRIEGQLVSFSAASADGRRLSDVRLYSRDVQGRLTSRTAAARADWTGEAWVLRQAQTVSIGRQAPTVSAPADRVWRTVLTPEAAVNLTRGEGRIAARAARESLSGGAASSQGSAFYRTRLQRTWAEPLAALVMLLLAAPVALASQRGGRQALWMVGALAAGLLYLMLDGLMTSFGQTAVLPAWFAAWAAPVTALAAAGWALVKIEG